MNFNHKNYSENSKKFFTQEEIDKLSYNEKFFPACKCGKKKESRWLKCSSGDEMAGKFYLIAPFRGKNGEEVCHKCAPCVKCGKENYGDCFAAPHVKTDDNPSGEWATAYCSVGCFNGEKPSLPEKEPGQVENCNYCGKLTKVNFNNSPTEKTFCSRDCYVAAGNKIHKGKCRIAGCSKTAYYECMDLCLGHSKPCRGTRMGKRCNLALGTDEGDFCGLCKNQNEQVDKRNCSHCGKLFAGEIQYSCSPCGTIYCSKVCCEVSAPQCKNKQGKKNQDNQAKPVKFIVDSENTPAKSLEKLPDEEKKQTLIINLRSVKQITLSSDNNLVIEFNKTETNSASQAIQVVNDKQISSSQELQKVKSYLKESGEKSVNQQELNNILNSSNVVPESMDNSDKRALAIGLSIIAALIGGLTIRLLMNRKRKVK